MTKPHYYEETITRSAEETSLSAGLLPPNCFPRSLCCCAANSGGKTTLVKGIAEGFEAARAEDVTSPTFTLVHEYRGPRATLYHIDLYRIDTPAPLKLLALTTLSLRIASY